jgi:hypothetical protein
MEVAAAVDCYNNQAVQVDYASDPKEGTQKPT